MKQTVLNQAHRDAGAKMVDFGGWDMPINYGSQIVEHHAVRQNVGMFDVSHMTVIDIQGPEATAFLYQLLANDITKLNLNQALYSTMLNHEGGVIDDLITYKLADDDYRVVVNAATREKDLAWIESQIIEFDANMIEQADTAMIAVQGPKAIETLQPLITVDLSETKRFYAAYNDDMFVGRTGYTGEDGVEIIVPSDQAEALWQQLIDAGVQPCGLGARDTLRLEAGMHLYGQDMDEHITPLECGLGWTLRKDNQAFNGAEALAAKREAGVEKKLIGLVLEGRGILRHDQVLVDDEGHEGIITSGGYSPSTEKAIAMAVVDKKMNPDAVKVQIRNKTLPCRVVKLPFVRNGKSLIEA
ncbi:glycine cleavage system aminomethyltransferase GcvT [Marinicella sp. S1101]|uniref:glycine cleavage system aminomethyltransferase GcvT n=1 Tax=Marinicella marina TaxID=2996016 RepID=UPI00226090D0|nr:glycine cleavage system aminomethyltransferase GcvT [Marinicella marina]MCX7553695.1 glycine cleavage system aminomethyltransferase GcvT [Marinicella marina]MDJ1140785.1 glycine cleavage system aminomethyltransferase GcvT [Marinicella marina]